jgi:hypothetical protein
MITRRDVTVLVLVCSFAGTALGAAPSASAGGIGDVLSPAFGTNCANHNTGAHADGLTRHGTGTVGGNLAGLPLGSALNQCGGADLPLVDPNRILKVVTSTDDLEYFAG